MMLGNYLLAATVVVILIMFSSITISQATGAETSQSISEFSIFTMIGDHGFIGYIQAILAIVVIIMAIPSLIAAGKTSNSSRIPIICSSTLGLSNAVLLLGILASSYSWVRTMNILAGGNTSILVMPLSNMLVPMAIGSFIALLGYAVYGVCILIQSFRRRQSAAAVL